MDIIQEFMDSPLVTWVRTFESDGGKSLSYAALADGVFLFDVMTHISPRSASSATCGTLNRCPEDSHARLGNLSLLLSFVKAFYHEFLHQVLLSPLPDVVKVSKDPEGLEGVRELRKVVLLVLGCAVQSPIKEDVIANIKGLHIGVQHEIVQCIQEVTDNPECVWPPEWCDLGMVPEESAARAYSLLVGHCKRLALERDKCSKAFLQYLLGESDDSLKSEESVHHLGVQLAEAKAQLRRRRQELDEKVESFSECKEELEEVKETMAKLRQENIDLVQEARSARAFRDEADILRERGTRVDALEAEVARYRDKMADVEFYKSRVEELREDNRILVETKEMLEDQLATSRRRAEQVLDLENSILQLKQQISHMEIERDSDRTRLLSLLEENSHLEMTNRSSLSESATLSSQMEALRKDKGAGPSGGGSVGSDLIGDAKTRVLKLELDNQRLEAEMERVKRESQASYGERILELERENKRLSVKVTHLQESSQREKTQMLEVQQILQAKEKEAENCKDVVNTVKMNAERQVEELQTENLHLQDLLESLRERQTKSHNGRLADAERENRELTEQSMRLQSQVSRLEYEKAHLSKVSERLREASERLGEVEAEKAAADRENKEVSKAMESLRESVSGHDVLEESHASLQLEFNRVSKVLGNTKEALAKLESAQSDKDHLEIEVSKLKRTLSTFQSTSTRLGDLETERDHLLGQLKVATQQLIALKVEVEKVEQMEVELMTAGSEVHKVKRAHEGIKKKMAEVEKEKGEVEAENTKLVRSLETLKLSTLKVNELERELTDLETSNDRLDRDNRSIKKEVDRLKSSLEVKDSLVEDMSSKLSKLERENKKLAKDIDGARTNEERVRTMEQQKREMDHQILIERKTLSALREDLVAEKVKSQQLSNQLEGMTSDLSKLGLNADNLSRPMSDAEEDRYKALEAMLEETLKRSVEIREEKISSLEARLAESALRNQQLKKQLLQVRSDYDSLLQRTQEEGSELSLDSSREMQRVKEQLHRANQEKLNLENDVTVLTSQSSGYRDQVCALQSQVTSLSNQSTAVSEHAASLQGETARLQVESTTLQAQSASLIAHNSSLQTSATHISAEKDKLKRAYDARCLRLSELVSDHESLDRLHRLLASDYDTLDKEHNDLKTTVKTLKTEIKTLKEKQKEVSATEDDLVRLRENLEAEMRNLKNDATSLANLRAEHSRLKDDFRSLFTTNERVRTEYKSIQEDYKGVKTENNSLKLRMLDLGGQLSETRDQMAVLDVQATKLNNKCQVLEGVNSSLEESRRSLMHQVSLLLSQYHDLLTTTLQDKHQFHQEEKNFTDKLNHLRRQKEKLEEKIMDQYRNMDNSQHKKRGFGSNLVKKVRKAGNELMNKVPRSARSRSRNREELESPDPSSSSSSTSSMEGGSSPTNSSLDSCSEGGTRRRSSLHVPPSPSLSASLHEGSSSLPPSLPPSLSLPRIKTEGGTTDVFRTKRGPEISAPSLSSPTDSPLPPLHPRCPSSSSSSATPAPSLQNREECDEGTHGEEEEEEEEEVLAGVEGGREELSRAGSRRGLYIGREGPSPAGGAPSPHDANTLRDSLRSRATVRSTSTNSISQHTRNIIVNNGTTTTTTTLLSPPPGGVSSPKPPLTPTPLRASVPPPTTSTPKNSNSNSNNNNNNNNSSSNNSNNNKNSDDDQSTPKLPPRNEQNANSTPPQLPPRSSRRPLPSPSDHPLSSHPPKKGSSPAVNGGSKAPAEQPPPTPPPPRPPPSDTPVKQGPQPKDRVDNSVWYEYGCV